MAEKERGALVVAGLNIDEPNLIVGDDSRGEFEPWERLQEEPRNWFLRFQRYYLYRGLARSVRRSYYAFLKENYPKKADVLIVNRNSYNSWLSAAKKYYWVERANAWDERRNDQLRLKVLEASRFLMDHADEAAQALVDSLLSPRLAVSAANSILNRIGIPEVTRQELLQATTVLHVDDIAELKEQVRAWENQTYEQSG